MPNGTESPIKFPPGYDLNLAKTCSFIVNTACNMCEQWIALGKPGLDKFSWKPMFLAPIWSSFTPVTQKISEPFAVFAHDAENNMFFLAFRGSQTADDIIMDAKTGLVPYTPPTSSPIKDIQVHHGFYDVFNGLDQTLNNILSKIASTGGQLIVAGHSLGSALATLTVPLACAKGIPSAKIVHYNQASPKVGNSNFLAYYNGLGVKQTFRLVNVSDVVPTLPKDPAYVPVGVEAPFDAAYPPPQAEQKCHNPCCSYFYALLNPDAPYNPGIDECMTLPHEFRIP